MSLNLKKKYKVLNRPLVSQLQKMIFIFNAVEAGWSVSKIGNDHIELHQKKGKTIVDNLENFVKKNLDLANLYKHST